MYKSLKAGKISTIQRIPSIADGLGGTVPCTLPYEILGEFGAGRVMLKPASRGTGIIAGGAVRAVMEAAGVNDVLAKAIGTNNPHNVLRATMAGLAALRSADAVSEIRGMKLEAPRK